MGTNSTTEQASDTNLVAGMLKRLPATFTTTLNGQPLGRADILAKVQARVDGRTSVASKRGALKLALQALDALILEDKEFMVALKRLLLAMFVGQEDALADLGLPAPKVATRTVAQKQAAAVKAKATRLARHTVGPKAKLAITGATVPAAPAASAPVVPAVPGSISTAGHS